MYIANLGTTGRRYLVWAKVLGEWKVVATKYTQADAINERDLWGNGAYIEVKVG